MNENHTQKPSPGEYIRIGGDAPDRKTASFRLLGDDLDPDAISQATGLRPDHAQRKGDPHPQGRGGPPRRTGLWMLESPEAAEGTTNHLEDHLTWLLDQLEPVADRLEQLCAHQRLKADFFCGYFMNQINSGFDLTPRTLARVAALDASLGLDIYGPDSDAQLRTFIREADD